MIFLSGIFLAALPLVALPVLIHFYRGRQRDVIPWGAMLFLTKAVTKGRSMQRLEELLLLALRVGAIVTIVFALAQPMIHSPWWGTVSKSEVILVIDNSLSMARTVEGISPGNQLKENVQEVLTGLGSKDCVHVMLASCGGEWLTAEGISADPVGKEQLTALIHGIEPTLGKANLLDGLQRVVLTEAEGNPRIRRIVVFTDNQANSWQLDAAGAWRQLEAARLNVAQPTTIEIVDCQTIESEFDNVAVMQLNGSRKIVQPNEPLELSALVSNVGEVTSEETTVQWWVDDKMVETSNLAGLEPGQSTQVNTILRLEEPGTYTITCQIDLSDQIELDQQTSVVVEVSDQLPILLVHDPQQHVNTKSAAELLMAALGYNHGKAQTWHSVYYPVTMTTAELAEVTFSNYRCVIMTDLVVLEQKIQDRLATYVAHGGGLWAATGRQTDKNAFNARWYDHGQGLSPVSIVALKTIDDTNEPAGMFHPPEHDHPATAQLANTTQLDIDEGRLFEYWQFHSSGNGETASENEVITVSVIVESGDGSPLVVENYYGQGRVLLQAFPLGLAWTNLPQLKSYVVMVHDWLDYLTAGTIARYNLTPGSTIVASPPVEATYSTAHLVTPDGFDRLLVVHKTAEGANLLRYSQAQQPGPYRVEFKSGSEVVASVPYYVARDTSESQWDELTDQDREKLLSLVELQLDAAGTANTKTVQLAPSTEPLWGFLLLMLIVFLACELLLSNWLGRQRSGVAIRTT